MNRRLISVLTATLLCLTALPWTAPLKARPVSEESTTGTRPLADRFDPSSTDIKPEVLRLATSAVECAIASGDIEQPSTLTVIDYSRASIDPRLWVFDLSSGKLLFRELVAHGRNTGDNLATRFSDELNSRQTSLGLFRTGGTYVGSNGYSLRLDGLEPGFNGHARDRAIVMHGAPYVDAKLGAAQGRIGRSWGCPALREGIAREVIDTIRGGGVIFAYYPDANWLKHSRFLIDECKSKSNGQRANT